MEQDLRKLFETDEFPAKKLAENHEEEFAQKLHMQTPKQKNRFVFFGKIAASVAALLTLGYFAITFATSEDQTPLQKQVAEIEKSYIKQINQEWDIFVKTANDPKLVNYYEERLDGLKEDYDTISKQFSEEPNNIVILEELIQNLQRRLELLKNIQEQIETNKKNKRYETIII